ncbi:SWF1 spore Wall Formation [Fusarium sp. NRRL 52700]|nr:SWF1 spore Wall Formation [Fusarium sp. NRRL 52700]
MGASSLLAALTSPLVWGLLLYTLYLVYCGTTTNETLKWSDWKEDMRDGFAFRRSMPANRQKNERVEPRFTRWPVEVQQVIVTTQDGQPPKDDELRYPGEGEWERVWNLSDVENLYDMGLWDNLVDIFRHVFIYLFDTWAPQQAQQSNGLNYARYLNSQPRASVVYGFRGFPSFITLRYFLLTMSIFTSVGYKFAIVSPDSWIRENCHPQLIEFIKSELSAVKNGSLVSEPEPWINDFPLYDIRRVLIHINQISHESPCTASMSLPPNGLAMVGHANCFSTSRVRQFYPGDVGKPHTQEVVLVANGSVGKGDFYVTEDPGGWHRMETTSTNWFDPPRRALVESRLVEFGSLQSQWAKKSNKSSES